MVVWQPVSLQNPDSSTIGPFPRYKFGVDPRRHEYFLIKLLQMLLYFVKRGATKIVLKIFFKKVLIRTALKSLPIDFID